MRIVVLSLMSTLLLTCKTTDRSRVLDDSRGLDDARDNRSVQGGLRASADTPDGIDPQYPRFSLSADFPSDPEYLTPAPPFPRMEQIKGADLEQAKQAALLWMNEMQAYIYEDMNQQNEDPNRNFRIGGGATDISKKRWYHMPWLHSPRWSEEQPGRGREAIWGLTRELDMLGPVSWPVTEGSECLGQNWGIGFFNEPGGFTIGQVFPKGSEVNPEAGIFPPGTVSFKMLFTSVTPEVLPAIEGAWTIQGFVNGQGRCLSRGADAPRTLTTMRHIQMDVMMKYGNKPTDWIFGVFVYNKKQRTGFWQGMEPVGVQWGIGRQETLRISAELAPNGFEGRLNGPADNPRASCYACHARAQWPEPSLGLLPFAPRNAEDRVNICVLHEWGGAGPGKCRPCNGDTCIPAGEPPVVTGGQSMDFALQFGLALRNRSLSVGGQR